jgi:ABC-type branched-subunit amino acid transport system ATPase component
MLQVRGLTKFFGGLLAVDDFDLDATEEKITGLIGPNGAGKSTVFNMITGYIKPDKGTIQCDGNDVTRRKPYMIARQFGIVRTFQTAPLFSQLTVLQSVIVGVQMATRTNYWKSVFSTQFFSRTEIAKAEEALEFLELMDLKEMRTVDLPHGDLQRLRLGIAIATQPRFLLLDEPFSGMNAEEIDKMSRLLISLKEEGKSIVMVEHNMGPVMSLCDRITVISFGKKICEGSPKEIMKDKGVIECYLGEEYAAGSE